jgi:hypothetical protein
LVGLAQAAALLLALNLYWKPRGADVEPPRFPTSPIVAEQTVPSLDSVVDVEGGQVLLIHSDGPKVEFTDLAVLEFWSGDDPWNDLFNRFESTSTVVAMTE